MSNEDPFVFDREQSFKGIERTSYWCMLAILYSLFSILPRLSFLSFSLPFLSHCLLICCYFLLEIAITVFVIVMVSPCA